MTSFNENGFAVIPGVLASEECLSTFERIVGLSTGAGSRNFLGFEWCSHLAARIARHPDISPLLGDDAVAVLCTYGVFCISCSAQRNCPTD